MGKREREGARTQVSFSPSVRDQDQGFSYLRTIHVQCRRCMNTFSGEADDHTGEECESGCSEGWDTRSEREMVYRRSEGKNGSYLSGRQKDLRICSGAKVNEE